MAGTISSLGAGAGVLTQSVIDKLKAADTAAIVTPIDTKITLQKQKGTALSLLSSLFTTFQTSVNSLNDSTLYQKRTVSGNTSAISVTANAGVATQSLSISNTVMAKQHVLESGSFASTDTKVATGNGTMSLGIDGTTYNIPYTASMSLDDLKTAINDTAGSKIKASTLKIGSNDYRLVLTSQATGSSQNISVSDSSGGSLNNSLYSKQDMISTGNFSSPNDLVASSSMTSSSPASSYNITMNGKTYNIPYTNTTTLQDLTNSINSTVGSSVASIKQSGTSYQLMINSTAVGEDSILSVADNGGFLNTQLTTGVTNYSVSTDIQKGSDASFKYNGIAITRSSNTITDLIPGVNINLLQDGGSSNIAISQDVTSISDAMSSFVQNYNTLTSQLTSMTTSDPTAGTVGIFNGDSSITTMAREITRLVTSTDSKGYSLAQFGIDLKQDGTMSFNSSTFTTKFNQDPTVSEQFFTGLTTYDTNGNVASKVDGVFTQLSSLSERYMGSYGTGGIINTLITASDDALTTLNKDKTKAQAMLDARYETMTARFSAYDAMMAKLDTQFSSLNQQISMAVNGK